MYLMSVCLAIYSDFLEVLTHFLAGLNDFWTHVGLRLSGIIFVGDQIYLGLFFKPVVDYVGALFEGRNALS